MGWLELNPDYAERLRRRGLCTGSDFLDLNGVILGGHPDRHVMQVDLGPEFGRGYLKKEHRVRWRDRLRHLLGGFGWVSKSVREARLLREVRAAGFGCPEVMAAGEEGGRAFLLLREITHATDLREHLAGLRELSQRNAFAHRFGVELARLHRAGFFHPDLFSKHVLVQECGEGENLCFLDWQRGQSSCRPTRARLVKMLSALDATLGLDLVSERDRLRCLYAMNRMLGSPMRKLARAVRRRSQDLRCKRRIREIAQPPLDQGSQNLIWLDGEAFCVTREFYREMGPEIPSWLQVPASKDHFGVEESQVTWRGRCLNLVRRWLAPSRLPFRSLRRFGFESPEFAQAGAIYRLERYRIVLPRLLAVGHRQLAGGRHTSFVLTEPPPDHVPLVSFLQTSQPPLRQEAARQAGATLRKLHEAGYGLRANEPQPWQGWGIQEKAGGGIRVILHRLECIEQSRAAGRTLARRDLSRCRELPLSRSDSLRFYLGYHATDKVDERIRGMWPRFQQREGSARR